MHRLLPVCLLASCGVFGLNSEQAAQLTTYQQNAKIYYDGGDLGRAIDQAQKGLGIDPDDYGLLTIWAWCLLRMSGNDATLLARSHTLFERLMDMRSMSSQSHQALLGYGLCLEKVAMSRRQQAQLERNRLQHQALEPAERAEIQARADEHERVAESSFRSARRVFERLLENGEELLLANKALMEVNGNLGEYPAAVRHGLAYLEESRRLQDWWRQEFEQTTSVAYEQQQVRINLAQLREEEIEVRAMLANIHAKQQQWEAVVEQLDVVLRMDRSRSIDYYNRGLSLQKLGRREEARNDFGTFLQMTNLPAGDPRVIAAVQATRGILVP